MRRRRMGAVPQLGDPRVLNFQPAKVHGTGAHGAVVEEIEGLIKVYKDGHVERLPAVAEVPASCAPQHDVVSQDVGLAAGVWGRLYVPSHLPGRKLPLVMYFHGGGFCVGSAAWRCYHEFLARLASQAACVVLSVNYRLAPEHRLPAAYDDGLAAVRWVKQQAAGHQRYVEHDDPWWRGRCDFGRVFLGGDSAGATTAYHVAARLGSSGDALKPAVLRGLVLIQPFFGGAERTWSEKNLVQPPRSVLTLATSDCYWRMALPPGADRDHPWCNPLAQGGGAPRLEDLRLPPVLVCVAELDILRDRNTDLCKAMRSAGKSVEQATFAGVGHAFQLLLHSNQNSHVRTMELLARIRAFMSSNS